MEWISVKDRLPNIGNFVFGYGLNDGLILGIRIQEDGSWITDNIRWSGGLITHWMPLPDPPEAA